MLTLRQSQNQTTRKLLIHVSAQSACSGSTDGDLIDFLYCLYFPADGLLQKINNQSKNACYADKKSPWRALAAPLVPETTLWKIFFTAGATFKGFHRNTMRQGVKSKVAKLLQD